MITIVKAEFVSRSLLQCLTKKTFTGSVVGIYQDFCNILGNDGHIITISIAPIGKSPFSVLIPRQNLKSSIIAKMNVRADPCGINVGNKILIILDKAETWDPKMLQFPDSFCLKVSSVKLLFDSTKWFESNAKNSNDKYVIEKLISGANELQNALAKRRSIKKSVTYLAGLGFGLTPSGDDYLLGVMASLWITKNTHLLDEIARLSSQKTTSLSAAYLIAASKGDFAECWHDLVRSILNQNPKNLRDSISKFIQIGASSGQDALAGFSTQILKSNINLEILRD